MAITPITPQSSTPLISASPAQGAYPCTTAPPEGEGAMAPAMARWSCRVALRLVSTVRAQRRVPIPAVPPLRKERAPAFGQGWWHCRVVLWLVSAYQRAHPTRGRVHPP